MRNVTRTAAAFVTAGTVAFASSSAGAAPAGADLQIDLGVSSTITQNFPGVPNGATVTMPRRDFVVGYFVSLVNLEPGSAVIAVELADGLQWGADAPDATENCTSTPRTAECRTIVFEPVIGQNGEGYGWDVRAERTGSFLVRAAIVEASTLDPNPANNTASITVTVTEPAAPQPPAGPAVSAGSVRLSPPRAKAGSAVTARVQVTAGGAPLRPAAVRCSGSIGRARVKGVPRAAAGTAACTYRTPRSAKGKTLRGAVSFTARGVRFTKRFAARLR